MTDRHVTGPARRSRVRPTEIACDESGAEGENLLDGVTAVFAHASVRLGVEDAAGIVSEVRDRIGSPAREYKANHLLRSKHRLVLRWLLEPDGPLAGNARVFLVEKAFFGLVRLLTVLHRPDAGFGPEPDAESTSLARTLHLDGPHTYPGSRWHRFLHAGNALLRPRAVEEDGADPVAEFFDVVHDLLRTEQNAGTGTGTTGSAESTEPAAPAAQVLATLLDARDAAIAFRLDRARDPQAAPVLDPLIPAIVRSVSAWSTRTNGPVSVVHDRQRTLTGERIDRMTRLLDRTAGAALAGLRLVDSRLDARVQLADFLAGVARRITEDRLRGHGDTALVELLRPHVDPDSTWGDPDSWPGPSGPPAAPGSTNGAGTAKRPGCEPEGSDRQ